MYCIDCMVDTNYSRRCKFMKNYFVLWSALFDTIKIRWFVFGVYWTVLMGILWLHIQCSTSDMRNVISAWCYIIPKFHTSCNKLWESHIFKNWPFWYLLTLSSHHLEALYRQLLNLPPHERVLRIVSVLYIAWHHFMYRSNKWQ